MSTEDTVPHVILICFPTQGSVNPMLRLAKRLASKGLLVTCCTTSGVGACLTATASSSSSDGDGDGVRVGSGGGRVRFEFLDDHGNEKEDLMRYLETSGPAAFAELLARQADAGRPATCVVGNPFLPWAVDVAAEAGVPAAVLWVQSCAVLSLYYHYARGLVQFHFSDDVVIELPGLPPLTAADVPSFLLPSNPYKEIAAAMLAQFGNLDRAAWVLVNSFTELEPDVLAALPSAVTPPPRLIPVGPLIDLDDDDDAVRLRGDLIKAAAADEDEDCVVRWLDAQPPRSVVYASVGSIVVLSGDEVAEMAHGLASTGRPFLWVVRPDTRPLLPPGFLEDTTLAGDGRRGMVVPWGPQERVLAHAATACFLTHCGWNSTLETVAAGVPVVAFPQWGDQCTDARFLVDELRMGVRLLRKPPLRREAVREAVEAVVAGPEADAFLSSAKAWSKVTREAVAPGGSADRHVQAFVDEVFRRASGIEEGKAA